MLYGYARVSTQYQNLQIQIDVLQEIVCDRILWKKYPDQKVSVLNSKDYWKHYKQVTQSSFGSRTDSRGALKTLSY